MVSQTLLQSSIWLYNKVALTNTTGWVNVTTVYWATQTKHDSETYNVMDRQMMTTPSPQVHIKQTIWDRIQQSILGKSTYNWFKVVSEH